MVSPELQCILDVSMQLIAEQDKNKLYNLMINSAMEITNADAGTLYLYDEEKDVLRFKILRNHTMKNYQGENGENVNLPPVEISLGNVCTCSALLRKTINIPDIYSNERFDFTGPKSYDNLTGYCTKSMLVIPLIDVRHEVIGVLQLINAKDENGKIIPFSEDAKTMAMAIATQTTLTITNALYLTDIQNLIHSFVWILTAMESKNSFNRNHSKNITDFAKQFMEYLNEDPRAKNYNGYFDEQTKEQLTLAAWMHDIGKVITPSSILNKATKLDGHLEKLIMKFDIAKTTARIKLLEGVITQDELDYYCNNLDREKEFVVNIEKEGHASDEDLRRIHKLKYTKFINLQGKEETILNEYEYECLSIKHGTLTNGERVIMNEHVVKSKDILNKIKFTKELRDIPKIASMHHEFLDGSGYPNGLKGDQIPTEARMLTILDIYEALTSKERPYKKPLSSERAFEILGDMAKKGKLDKNLVKHFKICLGLSTENVK